ncbi:MFS transporter [Myxococcota bacterium]|nr:MFS transporter [Myxococcota bacterium]
MRWKDWRVGVVVATLYFAEGWPYILVNTVSVVLLKDLGVSNIWLGLTSFFHLPWVLKMLWSPWIDGYGEKRGWIVWTQVWMALLLMAGALILPMSWGIWGIVVLFFVIAFVSATHDMAVDGWYIQALDEQTQAGFVGLRVMMYRVAMIAGSGGLVVLAGLLKRWGASAVWSWSVALLAAGLWMGLLGGWHLWGVERSVESGGSGVSDVRSFFRRYIEPFEAFFRQEGAVWIVGFIFLYRLGEALLLKMVQPFLLDSAKAGGLALGTDTVGVVYGTVGMIASIGGGIMGGAAIARWGLRRCVWPMMLLMNVPDLLYMALAWGFGGGHLFWVYVFVGFEQWGYGVGFSVFTVILMRVSRQSAYQSAFFAIATALMALGLMFPGGVSGWLQGIVGYGAFFGLAFLLSGVGMWSAWMLPTRLWEEEEKRREEVAA